MLALSASEFNPPGTITPGLQKLPPRTVLTVRSVTNSVAVGIRLEEVINEPVMTTSGFLERSYTASCFRPIVTKTAEEDSAMFHRLIEDIPSSITERLDKIKEIMNE